MKYEPDRWSDDWLSEPLLNNETRSLYNGCLTLRREICLNDVEDLKSESCSEHIFAVGQLKDDYYLIDREFLNIEYDLYLNSEIDINRDTFVAVTNISIFKKLGELIKDEMYIGGDKEDSLPLEVFKELLEQFPSRYELNKYAEARIGSLTRNYLSIVKDPEKDYQRYINRKVAKQTIKETEVPAFGFGPSELEKYKTLVEKTEGMLVNPAGYSENEWQINILKILILLYPRYIKAFREAPVRDSLSNTNRSVDFMLIDAAGYIDAIEIKKPFNNCIVTSNRYRDNHVPMRELNGTVMQLEKYLFHLNRWGVAGEKKLNQRYSDQLPGDLRLKIVNPSGMIIMGRDNNLTNEQRTDFEVIRRKYRHILEIMTYDDMLRRLKTIRDRFESDLELTL